MVCFEESAKKSIIVACLFTNNYKVFYLKVDPADLTPEEPDVMSCILMGNCSRWLQQAFNCKQTKED